jgi:hypothetical protein
VDYSDPSFLLWIILNIVQDSAYKVCLYIAFTVPHLREKANICYSCFSSFKNAMNRPGKPDEIVVRPIYIVLNLF